MRQDIQPFNGIRIIEKVREIISIFSQDKNLIHMGIPYLRAFSLDYLLVPFSYSMNGLFNGAGHTRFTLINNMLAGIVIRIPMAYVFCSILNKGLFGVGLAAPIAQASAVIAALWFYSSGKWRIKIINFEDGFLEKSEEMA